MFIFNSGTARKLPNQIQPGKGEIMKKTCKLTVTIISVIMLIAFFALAAVAQDTSKTSKRNEEYPKFDIFAGYSLMYSGKYDKPGIYNLIDYIKKEFDYSCNSINGDCRYKKSRFLYKGFSTSFTYNTTSLLGLTASFRYNSGDIFTFNESKKEDGYDVKYLDEFKKSRIDILAGPRFTFRNNSRVTPFVYTLAGLSHDKLSRDMDSSFKNNDTDSLPSKYEAGYLTHNSFGVALGGGLDVSINNKVAIRAIQADFFMANHPKYIEYIFNDDFKSDKVFKDVNLYFGVVYSFGK